MKQQYFCISKTNQFVRLILGRAVGLLSLSVSVDYSRSDQVIKASYPDGARVSLKLDPCDTFMLEAMRKKHDASITDIFRHCLLAGYYLDFGTTPQERQLQINFEALGLNQLDVMEFGPGGSELQERPSSRPWWKRPLKALVFRNEDDPHEVKPAAFSPQDFNTEQALKHQQRREEQAQAATTAQQENVDEQQPEKEEPQAAAPEDAEAQAGQMTTRAMEMASAE